MKKIFYLFATIFLLTLYSCTTEKGRAATVVIDCSGTYLKVDDKDYHVCNLEKVASFSNGAAVSVRFKNLTECNGSANDAVICYMLHENEGWIEVEEIK